MQDVVYRWLSQVLGPYTGRDRIMADMDQILGEYPTLRPHTEVFTYDDGRTVLLLLLDGTVAVPYHGQVYHIPVHMWFPRAYPHEAPIVFVMPTQAMVVRPGSHTAPDGRVTVPCMQTWEKKPEGSSLLELVRECQAAFSLEPPVMTKPRPAPEAGTARAEATAEVAQSSSLRAGSSSRPFVLSTPRENAKPESAGPSAASEPYAASPSGGKRPQLPPKTSGGQAPGPAAPPRPARPPRRDPASPQESSPSVHAPQRPVNPALNDLHTKVHAKLSSTVAEMHATHAHTSTQLRALLDDLERGGPAIEDEMHRLQAVQNVCTANVQRLTATIEGAQRTTSDLQGRAEPDVDHMLSATSLVENQLLQLIAEDQAIEDTLYQLSRALYSEQLSLDRFLKHTRMLAREQFMKRALALKLAQGLGWDTPATSTTTKVPAALPAIPTPALHSSSAS